jgi:phosphoesterase RecJ-like protein
MILTNKMNDNQHVDLAGIERLIRENDNFIVAAHVFPDGDNVGSMIAMKLILDQMGKQSYLYLETTIPRIYTWLEGCDEINHDVPSDIPEAFDMLISLDSSDMERLGDKFLRWFSGSNRPILNIDHHVTNTGFGDYNWVSGEYSATGEQIFELAKHLKVKIDHQMAIALYTSIATDSGRFAYSNTTAKTLRYASELVECGANPNMMYRNVYASRSLESLRLELAVLATLEYIDDLKLATIYMTREMLESTGAHITESEGIIEHVGIFGESIRNIIFFKELLSGEIKVSVRTKDELDASKISSLFDGGGHTRAGGYSLKLTLKDAIKTSIEKIREAIKAGKLFIHN